MALAKCWNGLSFSLSLSEQAIATTACRAAFMASFLSPVKTAAAAVVKTTYS